MRNINKALVASLIALSLFNSSSVKAEDVPEVDIKSIKFPALHDVSVPKDFSSLDRHLFLPSITFPLYGRMNLLFKK